MSHNIIFNQVEHTRLPKNTFDLSHDKKLSGKMGNLIPTLCMDVIPGDQITIQSSAMVRLAPTIAPFMHRTNVFIHHFFVPNRILWDNWEDFVTGGREGTDTSVPPYFPVDLSTLSNGSLYDYLGVPVGADIAAGAAAREISAIPFSAYQAIYNDYYRDQNLEQEFDFQLVDGQNIPLPDMVGIRQRCWEHDYFTSALPWTQKGPEAMLPAGGTADVVLKAPPYVTGGMQSIDTITGLPSTGNNMAIDPLSGELTDQLASPQVINPNGYLETDLSSATGASIIELRRAVKLQEFLEKTARGGSRYIEYNQVIFGVSSSDKRLQRPEYIGGSKTPIKVSEVLQTSISGGETPQGNMAGHAISVGGGQSYTYKVEEHGYIMSIMSITPESTYQQGIPKHFLKKDKFEYYLPDFAHIGEQPIINDELMVSGTAEQGEETWGYTPRYAEYKFINNTVHGDFRENLDFWHLGRKFTNLPALNESFVHIVPADVDRIFAVQDGTDNLWCQVINKIKAKRAMPIFGTPRF